MSRFPNSSFGFQNPGSVTGYQSGVDASAMSRFFNAVYAWMAAGLALTAVIAWAVNDSPDLRALSHNGLVLIAAFVVEIGLVMTISGAINRINAGAATALFMLYSAINGFVLSMLAPVSTPARSSPVPPAP